MFGGDQRDSTESDSTMGTISTVGEISTRVGYWWIINSVTQIQLRMLRMRILV